MITKDGQTDKRTSGRTDRHSPNVLEFRADQTSPRDINIKKLNAKSVFNIQLQFIKGINPLY